MNKPVDSEEFKHTPDCPGKGLRVCICDGYHTFNELYTHRHILFITLCKYLSPEKTWRSKLHPDGTMYDGWFVMGINKEKDKQITYHLPIHLWDFTNFVTELENAPEYDGHTPDDVLTRLTTIL